MTYDLSFWPKLRGGDEELLGLRKDLGKARDGQWGSGRAGIFIAGQ